MTCTHCPLKWNKSKLDLIKKSQSNCSVCGIVGSKLWACLEDHCEFIGCPESVKDHSSIHYEETNHAIAVNLVSFRSWCYICQKEVYLSNLFSVEEMKEFKGKFRKVSDPRKRNKSGEAEMNFKSMSLASLHSIIYSGCELDIAESTRGLTGLRNLGNTCYMNSALQSLSNCPQLTLYFLALGKFYKYDKKTVMAQSYYRLICDMWSKSRYASVSPTTVNSSIKMINPSFRGHQQQDTQELLRCLMDRLHEETKFGFISYDSMIFKQDGGDADSVVSPPPSPGSEQVVEGAASMCVSSSSDDSYLSCDSNRRKPTNRDESQAMLSDNDFPKELDQLHSSGSPLFRCNSFPTLVKNKTKQQLDLEVADSSRKRTMSSHLATAGEKSDFHKRVKKQKETKLEYNSVISDIFDGALWSSVQCKTCNSVWHTKETFQDLSLPIPGKDDAARLHGVPGPPPVTNLTNGPCANTEGYSGRLYDFWDWLKSWFFGPQVTLSDCLSAFFSSDELKGDNMYSCGKCNKLRNGIKYCRLLSLPEVLCIHLKRFRYEYLTSYPTKLSATVTFPLYNLDLSRYVAGDCVSEVKGYDLSSVIVHQGGAGGGHYTAYCKNPLNNKWYEFDDQYVTEVSESVVAGAEAYVLFYNKTNSDASLFREEVLRKESQPHQSVLMRFFVSLEWSIKFLTHAEPGPINNQYFLCRHGNVKPSLAGSIEDRTCCISEKVWHVLHQRFGGGPAVTRLQTCELCIEEEKRLHRRRCEEQEMYLKLSQVLEDDYKLQTYFISMSWFRKWRNFIQGERDAPEPINNSSIATTVDGRATIKKDGDYGEITADAWKYLHSQYGGGPAIPRLDLSFSEQKSFEGGASSD